MNRLLVAMAFLGVGALPGPAHAETWTFSLDNEDWGPSCAISADWSGADVTLLSAAEGFHPVMVVDAPNVPEGGGSARVAIGSYSRTFSFEPSNYFGGVESYSADRRFVEELARGSTLSIDFGRGATLRIPLDGSRRAVTLFNTCVR